MDKFIEIEFEFRDDKERALINVNHIIAIVTINKEVFIRTVGKELDYKVNMSYEDLKKLVQG